MGKQEDAVTQLFEDLNVREQGKLSSQEFIPQDVLETKITVALVHAAIPSRSPLNTKPGIVHQHIVQQARKVFAILVLIGDAPAIKELWKQGLRDHHLPLVAVAGAAPKEPRKLEAKSGERFGVWKEKELRLPRDFVHYQWLVLAPVIDNTGRHIHLDAKCALPFVEDEEIGGGAFGYVYKCKIHQAHQKGLRTIDGETLVAVKHFKIQKGQSDRRAFEQERENLEQLKNLNHPHMIHHYATCEMDNAFYVIFPWADGGNLKEYWKTLADKERTPDLGVWALRQMLGLSEALAALHEKNCRHGDLKPDNILRFDAATQPILVIGDVGISRFHTQETFLRNEDTATAATTPSYEAPEAHGGSKDKRSRRYDIWSLGCIYLEFVIWLLYGNDAVLELEQARKTPDRQSYFYKPVDDATISVHPKITEAIDALRKSPHCEPGSPMGHLVDLIEKDLLRIDIYSRAEAAEVVSKLREIVSSAETSNTLKHMTLVGPASKPAIFRSSGKKSRHQGPKDSVHGTSSFGLSGP